MEPDRASAVRRDLGCPLTSHQVIVELIGATTTQTGLRVHAELNHGAYPLRVRVRDEELAAVPLVRHVFHSECTYTIQPAQPAAEKPPPTTR
jgi:Rhodopirellula transposase DDE domain